MTPLQQTLSAMMTERPERYRALLTEQTARLRKTALEGVLKIGDLMPDFILTDGQGNLVFSDDLLARGPLVVVFFRGDWCPFCRTTLAALDEIVPEITAAGASLVALTLDTGDYVHATWHDLKLRFPVLSDVDGATALRFGTLFRVPDELRGFMQAAGVELAMRHGDASWFLPMPATFVADRSGILRHAYASGDITDRMEPRTLVTLLRDMASSEPAG